MKPAAKVADHGRADSPFPPQPLTGEQWALARQSGRWVPETVAAAEWAAQRLSEHRARFDEIKAEVQGYVDSVKEWATEKITTGEAAEVLESIGFFEATLTMYARHIRDASGLDRDGEPKVKTIKLPSATLETRKAVERKPKFTVEDMDALVKWALEGAPEALQVDVKKLKLLVLEIEGPPEGDDETRGWQQVVVTADGERVPGVDFVWDDEPREPTVSIRLKR